MAIEITYRSLTPDDYDQIISTWNDSGLPVKPQGRDSRTELSAQIMAAPEFFIGAFYADTMVGIVLATSDKRKGWINRLAVIPEYRGHRIARKLIQLAETALQKTGLKIISCLIFKDNLQSVSLFKSEGYDSSCPVLYFRKALSDEV